MTEPCYIAWARLTASNVVCQEPCLFYGVILKESAGSAKYAIVYDGHGTGGNPFHKYTTPGNRSAPFNLPKPVRFDRGLYVEMENGLDEITVLWQPL